MSRYTFTGKSAAAPAAGTTLFNLIGASGVHVKLRRVVFGFEGATTPSQATIVIFRATSRGTNTGTAAPLAEDSAAPASVTTVDTAWSTGPFPTTAVTPLIKRSFDVLAESEWVLELPDELDTGTGTANGLAAQVVDNAVASGVSVTWTGFEDE